MSEIKKYSEIEMAIEELKGLKKSMPVWWEEKSGCEYPREYYLNIRLDLAIQVLEEKQQREQDDLFFSQFCNGCNKCKEAKK